MAERCKIGDEAGKIEGPSIPDSCLLVRLSCLSKDCLALEEKTPPTRVAYRADILADLYALVSAPLAVRGGAPSSRTLLFLLLPISSHCLFSKQTCLPFSGLGLSTSLNLDHSRTILLAALHTLIQITTTSFLLRAPLTSLPPICQTSTTYCCPILMRRSCMTRSQPHLGRLTCRKRHA